MDTFSSSGIWIATLNSYHLSFFVTISLIRYELLSIETCLTHYHIQPSFEELEEALKHLPSYFLNLLYDTQILMQRVP